MTSVRRDLDTRTPSVRKGDASFTKVGIVAATGNVCGVCECPKLNLVSDYFRLLLQQEMSVVCVNVRN